MPIERTENEGIVRKVARTNGRPRTKAKVDWQREGRYVDEKKIDIFLNYWIASNDLCEAAQKALLWKNVMEMKRSQIYERASSWLTRRPDVLERKYQMLEERLKEGIASADEVLSIASQILRNEAKEEMVMVVGKGKGFQEVEHVQKDMSGMTRMKAVEFLGKHYGLADTRLQLEGKLPVVIDDDM